MRPIKFRAWDKTNKLMWPVARLDLNEKAVEIAHPVSGLTYLFDIELMQFTGLLDKNGKEIFEGDIIKTRYGVTWEVRWDEQQLRWRTYRGRNTFTLTHRQFWKHNLNKRVEFAGEVIGNIYENPELLNQ